MYVCVYMVQWLSFSNYKILTLAIKAAIKNSSFFWIYVFKYKDRIINSIFMIFFYLFLAFMYVNNYIYTYIYRYAL